MKKLSCLFNNHNYEELKDVLSEDLENKKKIKTFVCKNCGKKITFMVERIDG